MDKKTMGSFLAAVRKAKGMTQQEVADRLNVSNKAVSRWERGVGCPDVSLLPTLSKQFGVAADRLLSGDLAPAEKETGNVENG